MVALKFKQRCKLMADQHALNWPFTATPKTSNSGIEDEQIQQIIERCLNGDQTAYAILYNQNSAMIYRLSYSLLQHKEDAEEVLQDCFEYAFRKLHHYDQRKSAFKTWLYRIAISRCRNKRRRKWLPTLPLSQLIGHELPDKNTLAPDEVLTLNDRQRLIWEALAKISPKLRETAVLRYYEGLTYKEISKILGIPAKTAESRMRLAHRALKEIILTD